MLIQRSHKMFLRGLSTFSGEDSQINFSRETSFGRLRGGGFTPGGTLNVEVIGMLVGTFFGRP